MRLACVVALSGCGGDTPESAAQPAPGQAALASSPSAGGVAFTAEAVEAFDLRLDREGPLLVAASAGAVTGTRFDRQAGRLALPQHVATVAGRVRALVAGVAIGRSAVAWLRTADGHAHVERVLGGGRLPVFGPATELERWATSEQEASSNVGAQDLALWSTPLGDFRLLHRAAPMACEASAACATYRHSRLSDPVGESRSSASLAAPVVCPWALPGLVMAGGRMYYGLCVLVDGAPLSTLYLLQPEPQYAQAERALAECRPLGVLAAADATGAEAALFAADCPEGRVAVSLAAPGVSVSPVGPVQAPTCSAAGPVLHVGGLRVPIPAPRDRLEGFLPSDVAPAGARVLWTGDVFVVAELLGSQLSLRTWSCEAAATAR